MTSGKRIPLIYLPGIDGSPGPGEMVLANFPGHPALQSCYPLGSLQHFDELEAKVLDDADRAGFQSFVLIGESFGGALAQRLA
ncbi:MAG: hypothetical protein L6Q71_02690, partial [Planctomycetes bacterium]|nr:hypothetical protein [Planctomycetota bacterium]